MAFIEYTPKAKEKALKNSKRSSKENATVKVKRSAVSIGFSGQFMEDKKIDFSKGARIWFDPQSKTLKLGASEDSALSSSVSESGYQSISIGRVLKSFGFKVEKSQFNLPIKVNSDKTLSVVLEDILPMKGSKNQKKSA